MKKIHRFITPVKIEGEMLTVEEMDVVRQVRDILKIKLGESIAICDGQGKEWTIEVQGMSKTEIQGLIIDQFSGTDPIPMDVTLYLSLLKSENFELAVQKAVECGVMRIVPMISRRTIKLNIKLDRIQRIIREAAEQSGRLMLPALSEIQNFDEALRMIKDNQESAIFFDLEAKPLSSLEKISGQKRSILIGPEGGWDEDEIQKIRNAGIPAANLGPFVLRAETAAPIATYLLTHGVY